MTNLERLTERVAKVRKLPHGSVRSTHLRHIKEDAYNMLPALIEVAEEASKAIDMYESAVMAGYRNTELETINARLVEAVEVVRDAEPFLADFVAMMERLERCFHLLELCFPLDESSRVLERLRKALEKLDGR